MIWKDSDMMIYDALIISISGHIKIFRKIYQNVKTTLFSFLTIICISKFTQVFMCWVLLLSPNKDQIMLKLDVALKNFD